MLHVIGNLCRDTTLVVERFPEPGETLVARDSHEGWGGKGLNQAVAAARAGAEVVLHAAVGAGDVPAILADLAGEVWPLLHLRTCRTPTDTSTILVRNGGENLIVSATACARGFVPFDGGEGPDLQRDDILLMQGNLPATTTEACLREARRQGARTVLNPSPLWEDTLDWALVDVAVLNEGELARITDCTGVMDGARSLRDLAVGTVIVTRGAHGAMAIEGQRCVAVPAPKVAAQDTSGAGDVFCGVLTAHLHAGSTLERAMTSAVAAAALSVTRPGALPSCPTADELARLEANPNPGSFP